MKIPKRCKVHWLHGKFGYDAIATDGRGRTFNAINYGLKRKPSKKLQAEARRKLCGR